MIRSLDALIRSNLLLYNLIRRAAVFLCRFLLLEEGFSFLRHVEPTRGSIAIDVGSNDGTSIEMIRQIHPKVYIHSFDPVIAPKNSYSGVEFHDVALSENDSEIVLFVPHVKRWTLTQYSSSDQEKVTSQLIGDFSISREQISFTQVHARSISLDSLGLTPFFIKIDVEGHEESVIRGALNTITESRAIMLIEIQSLEKYRSIRTIMESVNYFNLAWPQKSHSMRFDQAGTYTRMRNNYLWLPRNGSDNWKFRSFKRSR